MSFICNNPECSAPEHKKGRSYPSAMECPFCDAPLVEVVSFSHAELSLIKSLPYVIAYPLRRALGEKHAFTKINLLKDYEKNGEIEKADEFYQKEKTIREEKKDS